MAFSLVQKRGAREGFEHHETKGFRAVLVEGGLKVKVSVVMAVEG